LPGAEPLHYSKQLWTDPKIDPPDEAQRGFLSAIHCGSHMHYWKLPNVLAHRVSKGIRASVGFWI